MSRQLLPKVKGRVKGKDLGKDRAKDRSNELKTKVQGCDEEDNEDEERSGRWRRQSAGDGDHYDPSQKRLTADERPSGYSMDRLGSDGTGFTDRASDGNDGSSTGAPDGSAKKTSAGHHGHHGHHSAGRHKKVSKFRLNFSMTKSITSAGGKSRTASTTKITTGASLIPDLNLIINRMRAMPDDSFVYMDYMLPHDSEYFTPYSLRLVEYKDLNTYEPFYTVTRHGVTFWHCSENFFTPLDQWQQEFEQFLSIIQIRSFSIFRLWKGFKVGFGEK